MPRPIPVPEMNNPDSAGSEPDPSSDSDDALDIIIPTGPEATIVDYRQVCARNALWSCQ
jgi:hypothetical protein